MYITNEQINDLLVTAFEGGINYWCGSVELKDGSLTNELTEKVIYSSDVISLGGTLVLQDAESDDKWELTKDKFLSGLKQTIKHYQFKDVQDLIDNHDAEVADVLIQYALFNEVVFG